MTQTSAGPSDRVEQAADSAALETTARVGLVAYGVVHLLIGWTAVRLAWGKAPETADSSGALRTLADQPFGRVLLGLVALGMVALALWQAGESAWGYHNRQGIKRTRKRISSAGKSGVYAALGISAASFALGSKSSGSGSQQETTSGVLGWPAGQEIVVAVSAALVSVGAAHVVKGLRGRFRDELDGASLSAAFRSRVVLLGQVGYVAKGLAFGLVGGLLAYAAWTFDPSKARGLDGALRVLLTGPSGRSFLTAMALGFMAFGLFAILQSRLRRM